MNEFENAVDRLANHASLPTRGQQAGDEHSLHYQLWLAGHQRSSPRLELVDDVVQCLFALNRHFNRPDPNHAVGRRSVPIPDDIAYSVACIIQCCLGFYREWSAKGWFSDDVLKALMIGTHRIAYSWEQLLAGDISDLLEGFELL